ncbi:MAG: hypothetical protein QXT26_08080, partial [Thermoproteota archaeon]
MSLMVTYYLTARYKLQTEGEIPIETRNRVVVNVNPLLYEDKKGYMTLDHEFRAIVTVSLLKKGDSAEDRWPPQYPMRLCVGKLLTQPQPGDMEIKEIPASVNMDIQIYNLSSPNVPDQFRVTFSDALEMFSMPENMITVEKIYITNGTAVIEDTDADEDVMGPVDVTMLVRNNNRETSVTMQLVNTTINYLRFIPNSIVVLGPGQVKNVTLGKVVATKVPVSVSTIPVEMILSAHGVKNEYTKVVSKNYNSSFQITRQRPYLVLKEIEHADLDRYNNGWYEPLHFEPVSSIKFVSGVIRNDGSETAYNVIAWIRILNSSLNWTINMSREPFDNISAGGESDEFNFKEFKLSENGIAIGDYTMEFFVNYSYWENDQLIPMSEQLIVEKIIWNKNAIECFSSSETITVDVIDPEIIITPAEGKYNSTSISHPRIQVVIRNKGYTPIKVTINLEGIKTTSLARRYEGDTVESIPDLVRTIIEIIVDILEEAKEIKDATKIIEKILKALNDKKVAGELVYAIVTMILDFYMENFHIPARLNSLLPADGMWKWVRPLLQSKSKTCYLQSRGNSCTLDVVLVDKWWYDRDSVINYNSLGSISDLVLQYILSLLPSFLPFLTYFNAIELLFIPPSAYHLYLFANGYTYATTEFMANVSITYYVTRNGSSTTICEKNIIRKGSVGLDIDDNLVKSRNEIDERFLRICWDYLLYWIDLILLALLPWMPAIAIDMGYRGLSVACYGLVVRNAIDEIKRIDPPVNEDYSTPEHLVIEDFPFLEEEVGVSLSILKSAARAMKKAALARIAGDEQKYRERMMEYSEIISNLRPIEIETPEIHENISVDLSSLSPSQRGEIERFWNMTAGEMMGMPFPFNYTEKFNFQLDMNATVRRLDIPTAEAGENDTLMALNESAWNSYFSNDMDSAYELANELIESAISSGDFGFISWGTKLLSLIKERFRCSVFSNTTVYAGGKYKIPIYISHTHDARVRIRVSMDGRDVYDEEL